ncbi:MAG: transglycosylase domain-containing protein [Dichotomicrobium sp.]
MDKLRRWRRDLARVSERQDARAEKRGEGNLFRIPPEELAGDPQPARRRSWKWAIARFCLIWGGAAAAVMVLLIVGAVTIYSYLAPDPLQAGLSQSPAKLTILSEGGEVITEKGLRRTHVPYEDMPQHLIDAVLAVEDRRFYWHFGFDPIGIVRAMITNYRADRIVQGGSTITQQLAKVLFLEPERTYWRKTEEVLLALWLEYRLEKTEILELYLNRIYFGGGNYGVEAAAQHYFGRDVSELGLYEAAILAGLIRAPSYFSPTRDLERARGRGKLVLGLMLDTDAITREQYEAALRDPPKLRAFMASESFGYAVDWVVKQVADFRNTLQSDLVVQTTIDYRLQGTAQDIVAEAMDENAEKYEAGQAAAVILDIDGAVKALVGGRDYAKSQFNRAVEAKRQPGSTFKPFVFLAGLEQGLTPESLVHDGPVEVEGWSPKNYNSRYYGDVSLREALARSMNTVAVRVSEWAGRQQVIEVARRLGIESTLKPRPSLALGASELSPLELTGAYVPFSNGGLRAVPHVIQSITDSEGRVLLQHKTDDRRRVISREHVAAINDMLSATIQAGTGQQAALPPHPTAGKTGTGQEYRDAWFIGYTAHYTTGVWLGNDDFSPMQRITGGSLPATIWRKLMEAAHRGKPPAALPGGTWSEVRFEEDRRESGSFWDQIFGTGQTRADTSLGVPSTRRTPGRSSQGSDTDSWAEDAFTPN